MLHSLSAGWGAVAAAIIFAWAFSKFRSQRRLPYPPGPKPKPIFGNILDIPTKNEQATFQRWYHQYGESTFGFGSRIAGIDINDILGDIVHVRALGNHIIILNTVQAVMDLFDRRSSKYSYRPQTVMSDLCAPPGT
jgi:hypothetical protein